MDKYNKSSRTELSKRRSRSRSPIDRDKDRYHHKYDDYKNKKRSSSSTSSSSSEERNKHSIPPAPKISMNFSKTANSSSSAKGIQIKLSTQPKTAPLIQKTTKISNVFNADDDSEPEEMPAEAKMRMRNIGKDTPTSSGPNSFGKTKQGFIDSKKIFERKLKQMADEISND